MTDPQDSVSLIPTFGRAWKVTVNANNGSGTSTTISAESLSWMPEPLRIEFETFSSVTSALWWADITIYNLAFSTLNTVITQGMTVQLEAGYQSGAYGIIFSGQIYQPIWERMNVTDYKLQLRSIVGINISFNNFAVGAFNSGFTSRQWVAQMAANAMKPINILPQDSTSIQALSTTTQSRGGIYHGAPSKYFEQAANFAGLNTWAEAEGQQILSFAKNPASVPTVTVGTGKGLVGTPQQTQFGMDCRVMLNPQIRPRINIQLDQSASIAPLALTPNPETGVLPSLVNQSGIYAIAGVRHKGDSRGNEWYTDLVTFNSIDGVVQALEAYGDTFYGS